MYYVLQTIYIPTRIYYMYTHKSILYCIHYIYAIVMPRLSHITDVSFSDKKTTV